MHCEDQRHLGLFLGYVPALAYGSCRVSDQGTTLRASDLHNAWATILNPFFEIRVPSMSHSMGLAYCSSIDLYHTVHVDGLATNITRPPTGMTLTVKYKPTTQYILHIFLTITNMLNKNISNETSYMCISWQSWHPKSFSMIDTGIPAFWVKYYTKRDCSLL